MSPVPAGPASGAPGNAHDLTPPARGFSAGIFGAVGLLVAALGTLVALALLAAYLGPATALFGALLALVPLTVVLLAIRWVDRWEPEPAQALWFAGLWGAGVSILASLYGNVAGVDLLAPGASASAVVAASVVAPVVEESAKSLGVLVLYLTRRRHFDGPVDGVVYAATVAAGFAFTENVLYFGQAGREWAIVFLMRGVFAPFAHVVFTACVGLALGLAARRAGRARTSLAFAAGLVAAMALHSLWNSSAQIGGGFVALYLVVQLPIFLALLGLLIWLRREESAVIRRRLTEYASVGWFSPAEVAMLSSMGERLRAQAWAGGLPGGARATMRSFQRHATELAYLRQRRALGRGDLGGREEERVLLNQILRDRASFRAVVAAAARPHGRG